MDALTILSSSASTLANKIKQNQVSSAEVLKVFLNQIKKFEPSVRAFISIADETALMDKACSIDLRRKKGKEIGPLQGLPITIKDNISTTCLRTTCASKFLENYLPPFDATAVSKIRAAGGLVIGKTNMDEFAMGSSTENSAFHTTLNPHDLERVPGGTSGGAAAVTAYRGAPLSLASDTGGSIRQPSSFCGVVGFKPSYGKVSRYGLVSYGSSLDQVGTISSTVSDAELLYNVIKGKDPKDSTSTNEELHIKCNSRVIGVPVNLVNEIKDESIKIAHNEAVDALREMGHKVIEVDFPDISASIAAYYVIACAEASTNLSRFDGCHFGYRSKVKTRSIVEMIKSSRSEALGEEVKRRILLGTYILSAGYYDQYYSTAQKARIAICHTMNRAFSKCDYILHPVSPIPPFKIGEKTGSPIEMYLVDALSIMPNLAYLPSINLPWTAKTQLGIKSVGVQLTGPRYSDSALIQMAKALEEQSSYSPLSHIPKI